MSLASRCARSLLPLIVLFASVAAQADTYDTATLVRIKVTSSDQMQVLSDERVDIVGREDEVSYKALLTDDQLQRLTDRGFEIEILYAEMQADRERWAEVEAQAGAATSYYTASRFDTKNPPVGSLMEHLLQQYTAHPDVTRLYNLGPSQDGAYDIIAMKISRNPDVVEGEPKIRIYGNIHGDEKGGEMVACDVLDVILAGYVATPQDPTARRLVDETEMWFIPMGNPWGNAHSSRYNSRGVDLNRNFWGPAGSDAPPAWSELETQAIRDLTEAATPAHPKKRFTLSLSFHEGATLFNSVWNYETNAPADEPIFWSSRKGGYGCGGQSIPNCPTLAPNGLAQAYKDGCTKPGFWYTEGYDWYVTHGDTNDWAYGAWTQLDTTVELNLTKTPPASQIPVYCAQHRQAVLKYMMKAFQGIHGTMTDQLTSAPLDGTVSVTATDSPGFSTPRTYQAIFTDPVAGDFHRVLQPGTYTVTCNAPGYVPLVIRGVVVFADTKSYAYCPLSRTALRYAGSSVADVCQYGGGNSGDGVLDAGEDATLQVTASNPGSLPATGVTGVISTTAPGITIARATSSFADVPGGGTGSSLAPHFAFSVDPGVACGTVIPFDVHLASAQSSWDDSFTVAVGQTTPATPQTVFMESFDGALFPPAGWAQTNVVGATGAWARGTSTVHPPGGGPHSGGGLAYFNSFTALAGDSTRLHRATPFDLPASAASAAFSFWFYHDVIDGSSDRLQVQVSTDGGATWTNVGAPIARFDGSTGWAQHSVALDGYVGRSGLEVGLLAISSLGYEMHIDDVQVAWTPQGACGMNACLFPAAPGEIAPGDTPAHSLAWAGKATLTWPASPQATSYRLYRGDPGGLPHLLDASIDSCTRYAGSAATAPAPESPDAGQLHWFLVTGLNGALEGPAGNATAGPRIPNTSGPCP